MKPELRRVGACAAPVVVVDDFTGDAAAIVAMAAGLGAFPPSAGTSYPGLRRVIGPQDRAAYAYAQAALERAAPFVGGGFELDGFDWLETSFSMVTAPPESLSPAQRAPHFDSVDPGYIALLHYLSDTPSTGTAFFRQRTTGIERVDQTNVEAFLAELRRAGPGLKGYCNDSTPAFEQIGLVEAKPDRLVIYQGALLHSGVIPPGMSFSADPRRGRLTANFFVQGRGG